jgi:hypothetical protein
MKLRLAVAAIFSCAVFGVAAGQERLGKLANAIVRVRALNEKQETVEKGLGTGAVLRIDEQRVLVLTAWHTVASRWANEIHLTTASGEVMKARVFRFNEELDIAVLESLPDQVIPAGLRCLAMKKGGKYEPAQKILVAAIPQDSEAIASHEGSLESIESAFVRYVLENGYKLREGESGSPLLDESRHIIGLNHGRKTEAGNVAIRGDLIDKVLEEWKIKPVRPQNLRPVLVGAMITAASGALSLKFRSDAKRDLDDYKLAITNENSLRYWDAAESNRKRGNVAAIISYTAALFTGYQLWRNHFIPHGESFCHVEVYPLYENRFASNSAGNYGVGLRFNF